MKKTKNHIVEETVLVEEKKNFGIKSKFLEVYKPKYFILIVFLVISDLLTKYIALMELIPHRSIEIIGNGFLNFTLIFNTGFVFGLFQDNAMPSTIATAFAIVFLVFYRWKNENLGHPLGWNLVLSGAFGNFIDKFFVKIPGAGIRFGFDHSLGEYIGVVDFIDFDWPDFLIFQRWPAFNIADSCVSIGLVILLITMKFEEKPKEGK